MISVVLNMFSCSSHSKYSDIVPELAMSKFMGSWYVQSGRFTPFEKDVYNGHEKYTWNQKEQRIDIEFTYNKGSFDGELKSIPQKGWIFNATTNSHWKVSPLWPLKFDYLVIGLAPDYSWTVIGVPDQKYVWIMTREKQFDRDKLNQIVNEMKKKNYDMDNLVLVRHQ